MKAVSIVLLVIGLAVAVALIAWQGVGNIAAALAAVGWNILWPSLYYFVPLAVTGWSWWLLFPVGAKLSLPVLSRAMWIGLAVNWLLPVAQIGGEVVKARLAILAGATGPVAGASVVVDKTMQAASQLLFALLATVLFLIEQVDASLLPALVVGSLIFAALLAVFYRVQRAGMFRFLAGWIARLGGGASSLLKLVGGAEALDRAIAEVWSRPRDVAWSCTLRLAARVALAFEVWMLFQFMGHPISIVDAILIEGLSQAVRAAAFAVPGAIGVQEAGFAMICAAIGIDPELGLALSLLKRARELITGVPALVAWKVMEGRHLLARKGA